MGIFLIISCSKKDEFVLKQEIRAENISQKIASQVQLLGYDSSAAYYQDSYLEDGTVKTHIIIQNDIILTEEELNQLVISHSVN